MLVARLLGPAEMGVMAAALLVVATLEGLTATGTETALVSHPGRAEADLDAAFTVQLARGAAVAALMLLLAPVAGWFFAEPRATPMVRLLALIPLLRGMASPAVALVARRVAFRRIFWWGLPETLAGFGFAAALALAWRDAWGPVVAAVAAQAVATAASYALAPYRPGLAVAGRGFRRMIHYGGVINRTRMLMFASLYLDNLLVGRLLGVRALGEYSLAFRIAELPVAAVTRSAAQVSLPVLSGLRRRRDLLAAQFLRSFRLVLGVNAACAIILVAAGDALVGTLLGERWLPIVPPMRILAVAMVLRSAVILCGELFYAIGRPGETLRINALRVGALAIALYPMLRAFGLEGVAGAVLASSAVGAIAGIIRVREALGSGALDPSPFRPEGAPAGSTATARRRTPPPARPRR